MPRVTPVQSLEQAVIEAPIPTGVTVVIGVSGGPDSVALLHAAARVAGRKGWRVVAVYVDHGLRPEDTAADISFVRDLAAATGCQFRMESVDVRRWAARHRLSIETAARELRYPALETAAQAAGAHWILVGHTRNDQAETLLMHLLRGAGLVGLRGMQPLRGHIVRPFLSLSRENIEDALQELGASYRVDPTNTDRAFDRNRLRHEVIPTLVAYRHDAVESIARAAALLAPDADLMLGESEKVLPFLIVERSDQHILCTVAVWRSLHPALGRHTLRLLAAALRPDVETEDRHIAAMISALQSGASRSGEVRLPHGLRFAVGSHNFQLTAAPIAAPATDSHPVPLPVPGRTRLASGVITASLHPIAGYEDLHYALTVCGPLHLFADARAVGVLEARHRRPGDRVRPLGLGGTKKLQDIFVDRHIPRSERDQIPVLASGEHIVWIPGIVVDERAAVRQDTEHVLHLTYLPDMADLHGRIAASRDEN